MRQITIILLSISLFFWGCSKKPHIKIKELPNTYLSESSFDDLAQWEDENHQEALKSFVNNCNSKKAQEIYGLLCKKALVATDPKNFFESEFNLYTIVPQNSEDKGLLTGYYEPTLRGSLTKEEPYIYPVYEEPTDLISVELSSIYEDLKNYRLRGRLEGNKLVPYYKREDSDKIDAEVICYSDSKLDIFFLEIQGSGRVELDNGENIYVGYANQNGHKYNSIGKYLIDQGEINREDMSMQNLREWLKKNPNRIDEVLNYNNSLVFFQKKSHSASGALGLVLEPMRSVAVDPNKIPLGSVLFLKSKIDDKDINRVVVAQDVGGAIKGTLRADMFFGSGEDARHSAGHLISPLSLWILLPKEAK
ncbi:MAG: murein transglycosylase A [Sulfurimonas sp.]|uniref:murein transglycosylase A n=1 Tax=Sulfurimonas sp. TaxID=2022749 RepID=UPI00260089E3|nr:murein transglycosylase A [Sulfurimonas sp.]MCK9491053.1 murein transglycosylase A [Sulfurimonas sp.]